MPKLTFESKEAVPEGLRDHAVEVDGKWSVGVVPESFRDKNISLLREKDALGGVLGKIKEVVGHDDVDKLQAELAELRDTAQKVKDGKLTAKGDVEAAVNQRIAEKEAALQAQIKAAADRAKAAEERGAGFEQRWKSTMVDTAVTMAVIAEGSGVNPASLPDILNRARGVFRVKDTGELVAMQGDNVLYGADGETSMQPKEWLAKLLKDAPYFAKSSVGGGATGDGSKGVHDTGLSQDAWNKLSPREKLIRARKAKA